MARSRIPPQIPIFLELGSSRVLAGALDWAGWCRSAKDPEGAIATLATYAPRYKKAIASTGLEFSDVEDVSGIVVVEEVPGNATTDFGAPGIELEHDRRPLGADDLERLLHLLSACWSAFDSAAERAKGVPLKKGPRGGGRQVEAMRKHLFEADQGYLYQLGVKHISRGGDAASEMAGLRKSYLDGVVARAKGELPDLGPRGGKRWTPRYAVRRSAWHALDHAWEIEDRIEI